MSDVTLRLTDEQILDVAGQLTVGTGAAALLYQLSGEEVADDLVRNPDKRLSRSALRAFALLALLSDGKPWGIHELAKHCRMSPSTTYRYVTTLVHVGLVRQTISRKYVRLRSA